jgi:hypothetical protein
MMAAQNKDSHTEEAGMVATGTAYLFVVDPEAPAVEQRYFAVATGEDAIFVRPFRRIDGSTLRAIAPWRSVDPVENAAIAGAIRYRHWDPGERVRVTSEFRPMLLASFLTFDEEVEIDAVARLLGA